ncbi:MAG: hypothetical protein V4662_24680 [Verrucomicrobiota bacterium]
MILNPLMLWGAALGICIYVGVTKIQEASNHRGPVSVDFDEGGERRLTEAEYKQYKRGNAEMMIGLALFFWIIVAKYSQKK